MLTGKNLTRRDKRNKLEIFYNILTALYDESINGEIKPTRVQQKCNLSYDKFSKNLNELKKRKLITDDSFLRITEKGIQLTKDYGKINNFMIKMKIDYLDLEKEHDI